MLIDITKVQVQQQTNPRTYFSFFVQSAMLIVCCFSQIKRNEGNKLYVKLYVVDKLYEV